MMRLIVYGGCLVGAMILTGVLASHAGTAPNAAYLGLAPAEQTVKVGDAFSVDILVDTGIVSADTVDAYVTFDSRIVQGVAIELNPDVFEFATYNVVDNAAGRADLSASVFAAPYLTGVFRAATIRFTARAAGATDLTLIRVGARQSDVYSGGNSIGPALGHANVTVGSGTTPTVTRHVHKTRLPGPTHESYATKTPKPTKTPRAQTFKVYFPLFLP